MKQYRNLLAVACFSLALHSTALSQWLDEGEFSPGVLAYKLRQVKNQFETAEAQLSIRTEVKWSAKKRKLGALYTSIESLEAEFRNGGYCPDLLDEEILTVGEKIRLILASPKQIGADQNSLGGQAQEAEPGVEFVGLFSRCNTPEGFVSCELTLEVTLQVITLLDEERSETYATLDEAIRAAQTWYSGLAGEKLPTWNYRVESLPEFRRAVGRYKSQIAQALGCSANRLRLRVEAPAGSWFFRLR